MFPRGLCFYFTIAWLVLFKNDSKSLMIIAGNKSKCRGLLRKGKDVGAKPIEMLIKAYDNFVKGKTVLIDDSDDLMLSGFSRPKHRSSESSLDSSPLSQGMLILMSD